MPIIKTLFHGTTWDNYQSILKHGFGSSDSNWYCSNPGATYFFDLSKFYGNADECIIQALGNAKLAAAVQQYSGNKIVVLQVEVDEELVYDDHSCENMDDIASYVYNENLTPEHIVKVYISDNTFNPRLTLFYLIGLCKNPYINLERLTQTELELIKRLEKQGVYLENEEETYTELLNT